MIPTSSTRTSNARLSTARKHPHDSNVNCCSTILRTQLDVRCLSVGCFLVCEPMIQNYEYDVQYWLYCRYKCTSFMTLSNAAVICRLQQEERYCVYNCWLSSSTYCRGICWQRNGNECSTVSKLTPKKAEREQPALPFYKGCERIKKYVLLVYLPARRDNYLVTTSK
jgi:hypothetical protein